MAGFCKRDSMFHGVLAADFTDQDHVGCLAQGVFQGILIIESIYADFALTDQRLLVRIDEFYGVFHCDDVATVMGISMIDQGRQ